MLKKMLVVVSIMCLFTLSCATSKDKLLTPIGPGPQETAYIEEGIAFDAKHGNINEFHHCYKELMVKAKVCQNDSPTREDYFRCARLILPEADKCIEDSRKGEAHNPDVSTFGGVETW